MPRLKIKELYNEYTKNEFLETLPVNTAHSFRRIFYYSYHLEDEISKDLYNFNIEQIEDVLTSLAPSTFNAAHTYARQITSYIDWAISRKLRPKERVNPLKMIHSPEEFRKFVDPNLQLYMSEEDLGAIEDDLKNPQDAVILRLLFEGCAGKAHSQIRHLREEDVNFDNNILHLMKDEGREFDKEELKLMTPEKTLRLIREAIKQKEYYPKNGNAKEGFRAGNERALIDSNYVVKSINTNRDKDDLSAVAASVINSRVRVIKEMLFDLSEDIPAIQRITPKNIFRSGAIYYAKTLLDERGKFELEEERMVAERFKIGQLQQMRGYVNIDMIKKLYK